MLWSVQGTMNSSVHRVAKNPLKTDLVPPSSVFQALVSLFVISGVSPLISLCLVLSFSLLLLVSVSLLLQVGFPCRWSGSTATPGPNNMLRLCISYKYCWPVIIVYLLIPS